MLKDNIFLLNISTGRSSNGGGGGSGSIIVPEILIHRRIIEMYNARDDFKTIDLNINTCRTLSNPTKVDIANALQHMKSKSKNLRRLSADIDYMDPSVHEFVLLTCLEFEEISITSTPFEQTYISSGIAMSIRHALTANKRCIRHLDLSCGISEETCGILTDAIKQLQHTKQPVVLEFLRLNLLIGNPRFVTSIVEGLVGISSMKTLQLGGCFTSNPDIGEPLNEILLHNKCYIRELQLDLGEGCAAVADHCSGGNFFDTKSFVSKFLKTTTTTTTTTTKGKNNSTTYNASSTSSSSSCKSLKQFHSNGITYMNRNDLQGLANMFPNLEQLGLTQCSITRLGFLDDLVVAGRSSSSTSSTSSSTWDDKKGSNYHYHQQQNNKKKTKNQHQQENQQPFQNLTTCDFTNSLIDIGEIHKLVRILPSITTITGFPDGVVDEDPIIRHYLEWNKYGRILNNTTIQQEDQQHEDEKPQPKPVPESVWPIVLERANIKLADFDANASANVNMHDFQGAVTAGSGCCDGRASLIFCLLKDLTRLRVESSTKEDDDDDSEKEKNKKKGGVLSSIFGSSSNNNNDDGEDDGGDDDEEEDAGNVYAGFDNGFFNDDDGDY